MFILRCCFLSMLLLVSVLAQTPKPQTQPPPPRPTPAPETFLQKMLRVTGISVTPGALKGDDDALTGDVWLKDLQTGAANRLMRGGGYRSPLVLPDEQTVWALKGETIFEVPLEGGAPKERFTIKGILKLAGVNAETRQQILLLRKDEAGPIVVELLSLTDGKRTALPYNPAAAEDQRMLAYLRGWERSYEGGKFTLSTRSESKDGDTRVEWSDVYLQVKGQAANNISLCNGVNCGQPALSLQGRYIVYLKAVP